MRLKRLELFGFKSFADKTVVHFDSGVTCIVGPNGCGKSNISDSIRWVLGERSAKLLRGSKMEDVIFNGTDFRKPLAYAEVSLTLDNQDRGLAIDYQEVTVSRRLYRSGDSEYLINKTSCRLKDIQDLILDTGIGSNSYSMIEQGRIDYILNADPEERRFLIEEAAGIAKFKVKKEEAIRKLERTEENRLRLQDIIHEVHRNIQYAERQARRAEKFKQELEKLKELEIQKAFHEISILRAEKIKREDERTHLQAQVLGLESQVQQVQIAQKELQEELRDILSRFKTVETERYALESKKDQFEQRGHYVEEKLLELAARRGQMEQESTLLGTRIEKSRLELALKQKDIAELLTQKSEILHVQQTMEAAADHLKKEIQSAKATLESIKLEAFQSAQEAAQLRSEFHRIQQKIENSQDRRSRQTQSQTKFLDEKTQWSHKAQHYGGQITELENRLGVLQEERQLATEKASQLETSLMIVKRETEELERSLQSSASRLEWLSEMESTQQGRENRILELLGQNRSSLIALRRVMKAKPGFEWALEAAFWSFSNIFLSENENIVQSLFQSFSRDKALRFEVLLNHGRANRDVRPEGRDPGSPLQKPEHPLIQCPLEDSVEIISPYQGALLPLIENIYLVREAPVEALLRELKPHALQFQFLCPNGILIGPRGVIAFAGSSDKAGASFQRGAEIQDLSEKAPFLKQDLEKKKESIVLLESEILETESQLKKLETERMDALIQKESFESLNKGVLDRLQSLDQELGLLRFEHEEMNSEEAQALLRKEELEAMLKEAEAREKIIHSGQESLLAKLEQLNIDYAHYVKEMTEKRAQAEHHEEKKRLFEDALALLEFHLKEDEARLFNLQTEAAERIVKNEQLQREQAELRETQKGLELEMTQIKIRLSEITKETTKTEEKLSKHEQSLAQLRAQQQTCQEHLHAFDMNLLDLDYREKGIGERLLQSYHLKLEERDASLYPPLEDEAAFQENLEELRRKVEQMGTVNLLALEEYEELKKRYDFLMSQQKDLDDAREQLLEAIRKINRTTKSLFEETFLNVQKTFQEYYQTLFQGGIAKLTLVDETNPLESGIDIVVRPPGKKLQHISLLSGGEKALTAMALLFALFKIKPSPFCVLDEVDAPLDEANIDRFLNVLKTFLATSQFIIVTHNRKTIAMGDALYGITMQEAGVSKIVSVRVNQDSLNARPPAEAIENNTQPAPEIVADTTSSP
ncbi:MAG: chromosome segregation protein SMC [Candidatus Omnitrophica bacterium]|nr:chromosome segregation protein SMC [Candidatus Omnitrophota bacterium]